jgi:hypothetical protein
MRISTMLFANGVTSSDISAKVGHQPGNGKVEVKAPAWDESGGAVELTDPLVDVFNPYAVEIPAGTDVAVGGVDGQWAIVALDQKCAVQIPGMDMLYFLTELPEDPDGLKIELGAWVQIPSNVHAWPPSVKAPEQVLCRSKEYPNHYKLYKYRREIEGTNWEDTGLGFGGTFTSKSWESFAKGMASILAIHALAEAEGS